MLLKKSISYFMNIMYKHIFLNFGVISFINKEMVSLVQLHTYKFGVISFINKEMVSLVQLHVISTNSNSISTITKCIESSTKASL